MELAAEEVAELVGSGSGTDRAGFRAIFADFAASLGTPRGPPPAALAESQFAF